MPRRRRPWKFLVATTNHSISFKIETNHTPDSRYSYLYSNSPLRNSNIFGNLNPSRQPIEMDSSSLPKVQLNFNDNPSLHQIEASSGITWGHGVVKRVLVQAFGKWIQESNGQLVTYSDI